MSPAHPILLPSWVRVCPGNRAFLFLSPVIQPGDTVRVVKWPHRHNDQRGYYYVVTSIQDGGVRCPECGDRYQGPVLRFDEHEKLSVPLEWCVKVPSLVELQEGKTT